MSEFLVSQIKVEEVVSDGNANGAAFVATQITNGAGLWGPKGPAAIDLAVDLPAPLNPALATTKTYRVTIGSGVPSGQPTVYDDSRFTHEDASPTRAFFRLS